MLRSSPGSWRNWLVNWAWVGAVMGGLTLRIWAPIMACAISPELGDVVGL